MKLQEIEITNPVSDFTISNQKDIQNLLDIINKTDFKRNIWLILPKIFKNIINCGIIVKIKIALKG